MKENYKDLLKFSKPELADGIGRMLSSLESKSSVDELSLNPTGVISKHFPELTGKLSADKMSDANRLIFSIMANDSFRNWASDYQEKLRVDFSLKGAKSLDKDKVKKDFAKAILESGDEDIVYALLNQQHRPDGFTTMDMQAGGDSVVTVENVVAVAVVVALVVVVTQIDITPKVPPTDPSISLLSENAGADLRAISEQIVKTAKDFKKKGL